jgi:hypothetical protein
MVGTAQSSARPINRYQETPFIVTKKHRQFHIGLDDIAAPFLHVPRNGGYRATLIGWAPRQWRGTHAPTNARSCRCSHLRSDRRVQQHQRQRRGDDERPTDDSASSSVLRRKLSQEL